MDRNHPVIMKCGNCGGESKCFCDLKSEIVKKESLVKSIKAKENMPKLIKK